MSNSALKESVICEADHHLLFDSNPLPMWVYDQETLRFLAVNNAAVEHYGYSKEEFLAMTIKEIRPAEEVPALVSYSLSKLRDGERSIWHHRKKDGSIIDVEIISRQLPFAERPARLILALDITERRQAERNLRESELRLQALVKSIDELVFEFDLEGTCINVWTQNESLLVRPRAEVIGRPLSELLSEDLATAFRESINRAVAGGQPQSLEYMLDVGQGKRWFQARICPIVSSSGECHSICVLARDITERRQAEEALRQKNREIITIWESMTDAFYAVDTEWRFTYVNAQAALALNATPEKLIGTYVWESFPEVMVTRFFHEYRKAMDTQTKVNFEAFYPPFDAWFEVHAYPSELGLSVYFRDITERKKTEAQLQFQKALLEAQSETSLDGILIVSDKGDILSYNQQFVSMWGLPEQIVAQRNDAIVLQLVMEQLANPQEFRDKVAYLYNEKEEESREELSLRDGRTFDRYSAPITDADGSYYGRVWYFRDVTLRKQAETELHDANVKLGALAITDSLTGISNRRAFDVGLQGEFQRAHSQNKPLSLILLDLDKFKDYNDTFGHIAGDGVLRTIGNLLREQAREIDLVARYGGEEFAVVLADADKAKATAIAERLRRAIEATEWKNSAVTASFGVATADGQEREIAALLGAADTALYHSKSHGRNRVTHYNDI